MSLLNITEGIVELGFVCRCSLLSLNARVLFKNAVVFSQIELRDGFAVSLDRIQVVKSGICCKLLFDRRRRETLVRDDNPRLDLIGFDEMTVRCKIQHVSGETLRADRLVLFQIEGIENRDVSASLGLGLTGKVG